MTKTTKPYTLIIGSNQHHAERHAQARGLPNHTAVSCDKVHLGSLDAKTDHVLIARPEADRANHWTTILDHLKTAGISHEIDTTG